MTLGVACLVVASCAGSDADDSASTSVTAEGCLVQLHGKGGQGGPPVLDAGTAVLRPEGPEPGWDGQQWIYADDGPYQAGIEVIGAAVDGAECERVVLHGFSNGASMVAKMYCAGETLDGRVVGYIVDDPVVDASSAGCSPAEGVEVALYWTGALEDAAPPGTSCADLDWTCEGDVVGSIDDYAEALGAEATPSVSTEHRQHPEPPELAVWLSAS